MNIVQAHRRSFAITNWPIIGQVILSKVLNTIFNRPEVSYHPENPFSSTNLSNKALFLSKSSLFRVVTLTSCQCRIKLPTQKPVFNCITLIGQKKTRNRWSISQHNLNCLRTMSKRQPLTFESKSCFHLFTACYGSAGSGSKIDRKWAESKTIPSKVVCREISKTIKAATASL